MSSTTDDRVNAMVPDTSKLSRESNLPCPSDREKVEVPLVPTDKHLKAFGYAPGGYMIRCFGCDATRDGLDKRATSCRDCAERRYKAIVTEWAALASHPTPLVGSWPGKDTIAAIFGAIEREVFAMDHPNLRIIEKCVEGHNAVLKLFENTRSPIHDGAFALNGQCDHPVSEDGK